MTTIFAGRRVQLPRRTLLRGAGALLALPFLEAMQPARAARAAPKRLLFLYAPNGKIMNAWRPQGEGRSFTLGPTMEPLAPFRDDLLIVSGLRHRNGEALGDGPGDHARASASYLTGAHPAKSTTFARVGVSIDQVVARHVGAHTRLPSLELSCDPGQLAGSCDSGYNCAYQASLSWRSETTPMPAEVDPRLVFDRLFGASGKRDRTHGDDGSVLDHVAEEARRLGATVGAADRQKLDEYLTSVRDVEMRLQRAATHPAPRAPRGVRRPSAMPRTFAEHLRVMSDLLLLAITTDSTRVVTFLFSRELSNRSYAQLGSAEGHHDMSHHGNKAHKIAVLEKIDRFHVEQLAYVLGRLRAAKEHDGKPVLDACLLVYGSGLSDGNQHLHDDLPTLVAGRGGGALVTGRHLVAKGAPMSNLWIALAQKMGVPSPAVERFGDGTGPLAGLDG